MDHTNVFAEKFRLFILFGCLWLTGAAAFGASREDFVGAWMNDDAYTEDITRILITESGSNNLNVQIYGECLIEDCEWTPMIEPFTGNPFDIVYHTDYDDVYLTLTLVSGTHMEVTAFYDYHPDDPRTDRTVYHEFSLMTEPDLVISRVEFPASVMDYGTYNWVTFYVQNRGAPGVSGPLRARIIDRERNGEPAPTSGYFDLSYTSPLGIGEEVPHQFSVGHTGSSWTDGVYRLRFEVDYDNVIPEADETNNVSRFYRITILDEYQLTGICRYNGYAMDRFADFDPISYLQQSGLIPGAEFRYYTDSGRYAINGIPETGTVFLNAYFQFDESNTHAPGNYYYTSYFDLSTLSPEERENYDLDFSMSIHMIRPWDNSQLFDYGDYPQYQPGIVFEWEPVDGAVEYFFAVSRYGEGSIIDRPIEVNQAETSYTAVLPVSNPDESYAALILARDAAGEIIGRMHTLTVGGGYGFSFPFTVDYECYDLPVLKLFVTDRVTQDISGTLWNRYYTTVTNTDVVPDAMFASAPDLPPCGGNTESSRTWVTLEDQDGTTLVRYCALDASSDLDGLSFGIQDGEPVPQVVKMVLEDRRCGTVHESVWVDTALPCPIGDLNGDCIVNLADLTLFSGTWLTEGVIP